VRLAGAWGNDVRGALRTLTRARAYAATVIAMIALGVAAGTILFTVYRGALLDPWPYEGGDRLVVFRGEYPAESRHPSLWSAADVVELRQFDAVFDHVIAGRGRDVTLAGADGAERVRGAALTPNAFAMLGIRPQQGRLLDAADARPGADPVVLIGYGLWQRRFGGDPGAVGGTLPIDDVPHVVVGVMPPRFLWWGSELWLPMPLDLADPRRDARQYVVQARLHSGVDLRQASAVLDAWARRVERDHAAAYPFYERWQASTHLLIDAVVRDVRAVLNVLLAAAALLMLVAGFNVATLLLARAVERRREFAVRTALGASRAVVVRAMLVENLVLAVAGGALGAAAAVWSADAVVALIPFGYLPAEANVVLDGGVVALAVGVAALVAVLAAIPAAGTVARFRPAGVLRESRGTATPGAVRVRSAFVTAQLALAVVVVAAALAVGGGLRERLAADPGFAAAHAVSFRVALPESAYPDRAALQRFALALQTRLTGTPGIEAAGIGIAAPLGGGPVHALAVRTRPELTRAESRYEIVAGHWFAALGVRVAAGRVFDERDGSGAQPVAVVNETFVRTWLGGGDPIGLQVRAGPGGDERDWLTIVGVVGDVRVGGVDGEVRPLVYQPLTQSAVQARNPVIVLRAAASTALLVDAARQAVAALDASVPVYEVATLEEIVAGSTGGHRLAAWLLGAYAVTVLLLAALGVYGIVAYVTRLAGGEFALRKAIGASALDIARLIGRRSLVLAATGIGIGLVLAAAALGLVGAALEYPLPATLPVLALTSGLVSLVVGAACGGPTVLGARTDPSAALRDG
jgi:putative ABC transport system permease protein